MKKHTSKTKDSAAETKITRKEAIKKTGIAALTAGTLLFLSPKASAQGSGLPDIPGSNW